MHKVSIYVPALNSGRTLGRCLRSILAQDHPLGEILVIDGGSKDSTCEIVRRMDADAGSRIRIRLVKQDQPGLAAARNLAIDTLDSEFIASCDADCILNRDWLSRIMDEFDRDGGDDLAGVGGMMVEDHPHRIHDRWRSDHMQQHWGEERDLDPKFLFGCNNVFRAAVLRKTRYDERYLTNHEDVDISARIKAGGFRLTYLPSAVCRHARRDDFSSLSLNYWRWHLHSFQLPSSPSRLIIRIPYNLYKLALLWKDDISRMRLRYLSIDLKVIFRCIILDTRFLMESRARVSRGDTRWDLKL